ncbi:MAG: diguanylate cyclase [Sporichthyaceae bacterium]|nr:diguanylate cyclase [Sporichthyaceae bacterium]
MGDSDLATAPLVCQVYIRATIAAAIVGCVAAYLIEGIGGRRDAAGALVLVVASVLNVEIARYLEGRQRVAQRPHKALSAWAFACVLLLPPAWLIVVVPACYAHTWWRGLRPPLWKWVGSAAFLVLAGLAAELTLGVAHPGQRFSSSSDPRQAVVLLVSQGVFLAVEGGLFFLVSRLNHAADEQWLKETLARPSFYATEAGMLAIGSLTALVWVLAPWFLFLLLPAFGLLQQAALHEPMRTLARTDAKTGLLRYEPWRHDTAYEVEQLMNHSRPWAVAFVDLDNFKQYNDTYGHLAGDEALGAVAEILRSGLRADDTVSRFGGEEFAVFLPDADAATAHKVAERLRLDIAHRTGLPGRLTASVGVAAVEAGQQVELAVALVTADRALYDAKAAGRDQTVSAALRAQDVEAPVG